MRRAPGVLMGLLAVLLVGWLVRVPASPPPSGRASESDLAPEPDLPFDESRAPDGFALRPVDPVTLVDLTEMPVATVEGPWTAIPAGGDVLLIEQRPEAPGGHEAVRRLSPPDSPLGWERLTVDPAPRRTWLGGSQRTTAWTLDDGRIRVRRPGSAGAFRTLTLGEEAGAVTGGMFIDDDRLALLVHGRGSGATPVSRLVTIDTATTQTLVDIELPGGGFAHGAAAMEWDLIAGLLVVMPADRASVVTVDPRDGTSALVGFPPGWPTEMLRPVVVARDGWVVVRDESPVSSGGIIVIGGGQGVVTANPAFGARQLVLGDGGRMLADVDGIGLVTLGDGLETSSEALAVGDAPTLLGTDGTIAYAVAGTGATGSSVLYAFELSIGDLTGRRVLQSGEEFLTAGAFVVSPLG